MKYLGINLTKDVKDVYSEKYRMLKKEITEDTNKWKHSLCSWIGRINIVKMSILPEAIYRFNAISIKIPMIYFVDLEKIFQKFIQKQNVPQIVSAMFKKRNNFRGTTLPYIKQYFKDTEIKTGWNWHIEQWFGIDCPERNPCLYGQLIFKKTGQKYKME